MSVEEHNTVRRSDWRSAIAWTLRRRSRTAFVIALLTLLRGQEAPFGLLRWQPPLLRWSFAAICWLAALGMLVASALRDRKTMMRFATGPRHVRRQRKPVAPRTPP